MTGRILVDGIAVFSQFIAFNDTLGMNYSKTLSVNLGSTVDFAVSPGGNEGCDMLKFTAVIVGEGTPPPADAIAPTTSVALSPLPVNSCSKSDLTVTLSATDNAGGTG